MIAFVGRLTDWRGVPVLALYCGGTTFYTYNHITGAWTQYA